MAAKVEMSTLPVRGRARYKTCECCPYGYHIDVDFVRYCEAMTTPRRRPRRRHRHSMDVMLGLAEPDATDAENQLSHAVQVFEDTLQRSSEKSSLPPLQFRSPAETATAGTLQNVREQIAASLKRIRELEGQVELIPVLQVNQKILQEEKRSLQEQLRQYRESETKTCDRGVCCVVMTRDVGVSSQRPRSRSVATATDCVLFGLDLRTDAVRRLVDAVCSDACNHGDVEARLREAIDGRVCLDLEARTREVERRVTAEVELRVANEIERLVSTELDDKVSREYESRIAKELAKRVALELDEKVAREFEDRVDRELERRYALELSDKLNREFEDRLTRELEKRIAQELDFKVCQEFEDRVTRELERRVALEVDYKVSREFEDRLARELEKRAAVEIEVKVSREFEERVARELERRVAPEVNRKLTREIEDGVAKEVERRYALELQEKIAREFEDRVSRELERRIALELDRKVSREFDAKVARELDRRYALELEDKVRREFEERLARELDRRYTLELEDKVRREFEERLARELERRYALELSDKVSREFDDRVAKELERKFTLELDDKVIREFEDRVSDEVEIRVQQELKRKVSDERKRLCDAGVQTYYFQAGRSVGTQQDRPRTRDESLQTEVKRKDVTTNTPKRKFVDASVGLAVPVACVNGNGSSNEAGASRIPRPTTSPLMTRKLIPPPPVKAKVCKGPSASPSTPVVVKEADAKEAPRPSRLLRQNTHTIIVDSSRETDQRVEPSKEMKAALKVINDSLTKSPKKKELSHNLSNAANIVQQEWFKVSGGKTVNPLAVEDYLDYIERYSSALLEYVVNMTDMSGNTALHYAVSSGNFDVVSILLDSKVCDINKTNAAGYTCVMLATLVKLRNDTHRQIIRRMFHLADVNMKAKPHGQTALMLATSHGSLEMVEMLTEAGADMNIQDADGSTALMCAADHGYTDIVKHIIAQPDCDVSMVDSDGSTALNIAMEAGNRHIGLLLYAHEHCSRGNSPHGSFKQKSRSTTPKRTSASPVATRDDIDKHNL